MRVLLLAFDLGLLGGVGTFNRELAVSLSKLGVKVSVIMRKGSLSNARLNYDLKLHALPSPAIPPKDVVFYLINMRNITNIVKSEGVDIIHDSSASLGLVPWLSKTAPVVATVHGSPMLGYLRSTYSSLDDKLRSRLFEATHKVPARILSLLHRPEVRKLVFVSKSCFIDALIHTPIELREDLVEKACVIYNGVPVKELRKLTVENANPYGVVFMGRLMEYKGVDRLLKAFPLVIKEVPEAELHIIGSGPLLMRLVDVATRYNVEGSVKFHGWLSRLKALKILAGSSVLVHPSLYESFGYVIAEAYAVGKPVVAHRAPYSIELVEDVGAGIVVDTFNTRALADAIVTLLSDSKLYRKLSQRAFQVAEEHFDIEKVARQYIKVYGEVAQ
ncbi:MAG: glycosyltransferase family 4 protein [Candidatus Nezhaarchaeota archaeon]|nr:glycosyltransferase family 4 protein [Candidatus Nezhaarchaeota archaeon]